MTTGWLKNLVLEIKGYSPIPYHWNVHSPLVLILEAALVTKPWESNMLLRQSRIFMWLNPIKDSIWTLKILVSGHEDLLILWLPKTGIMCKFSCLLKLSPINMECFHISSALLALCVWGSILNCTQGTPEVVNQHYHLAPNRVSHGDSNVFATWYVLRSPVDSW